MLPAWEIDLATATRTGDARGFSGSLRDRRGTRVALQDFAWRGPGPAVGDAGLRAAPGHGTLAIRDPRGQTAELPDGFESLGRDASAPVILFEQPGGRRR